MAWMHRSAIREVLLGFYYSAKSGAVLAFTQRFGHKDFIKRKSLLQVLERAWTWLFYHFKI
jgi:hypothetical protein